MITKIAVLTCLLNIVYASGWHGADHSPIIYGSSNGYGHGGYSTYVSPSYTAPIIANTVSAAPVVMKAAVPAFAYAPYAPAMSTVSRYQVHTPPIIKSYDVAPIVKSYEAAPIVKSHVAPVSPYSSYTSSYPVLDHGSYTGGNSNNYYGGYSGYGYGGYGTKYV